MGTAEIAIVISVISAMVAGLSLGWNIYRDVVLKARIKIGFSVMTVVQYGNPAKPQYVSIRAANHGPGDVTLSMVQMKNTSLWKRIGRSQEFAVVIADSTNLISGLLPCKLAVGGKIDVLLPYDADCLLNRQWSHVGLGDYFGRTHWAKKKDIKKANKQWKSDFGANG